MRGDVRQQDDEGLRREIIRRREGTWYKEPHRVETFKELTHLVTDPRRHRAQSIALVAESNGGKTALVKRFVAQYPRREGPEGMEIQVIYVHMTDIPQVSDLSSALLKELGVPDFNKGTHAQRIALFIAFAKDVGLKVVVLDEFHDCVSTKGRGLPFLRLIKGLMNNGINVVPVGTEELGAVLKLDPQLASRFNFKRGVLGRVQDRKVIKGLMLKISDLPPDAVSDAAVEFVYQETKGVLGHMLDLTEQTLLKFRNLKLASLQSVRETMDVLDNLI